MKSNAPGQLLGFSLQYPRALYHLLTSGPGHAVCVEVLGDVATITPDKAVITEEDKSSIVGNPLTDKSTDLWKTFSNWIKAIKDRDLVIGKTRFLLYTNQAGRSAIVNRFSSANKKQESQDAIDYAKAQLRDITKKHEIWPYFDYVVNQNESLLLDVVERFELHIGSGAGFEEVRNELVRMNFPKNHVEHLLERICGWLQKEIAEKIAAQQMAKITWDEFNKIFMVLFERARRFELIDFTLINLPEHSEIQQQMKIRPCYLKQLEAIGVVDDEIFEAVSDFLRAKVNRDKWIETGVIDEDVASDFETKLQAFWNNLRKRIEITQGGLAEDKRGQLLYSDCKSRQETIRGESPPSSTIAGTYHALADGPVIGWHPNWNKLFLKP